MDRQQLLTTIVGTTLLGGAFVMTARSDTDTAVRTTAPAPRQVEVATVERIETTRTVRLAGVTRAADRAQLSFPVPARLSSRPVGVGDRVRAGQVLATLDDREFQLARQAAGAALAELEVRLAQATREQERTVRLAAAEAATAEELEQTRAAASALAAARDAAAARLAETNRLVDESTLEAPFSGTVTAVHVEPGEWASPGRPVVELAGNGAVEVVVEAPESAWSRLAAGLPVTVTLPFVGLETGGVIRRVASVSMGPGGLFPVEVEIDEIPGLAAGLAAEVSLPLEPTNDLTVPLEAVLNPGSSRPAVFRINDERAERILVRVGQITGDRISIKGPLADGDLVAVGGHTALADRDPVEVF
jgi:RND family efflux transporter MFP subunit